MAVSIRQLIAAISPDVYCDVSVRRKVNETLRDRLQASDPLAYPKAAELALPVEVNSSYGDTDTLDDPFSLKGLKHSVTQRTFTRDAMAESLEAFYFQLLNLFADDERWQVTKLVDNFEPSPSSTAHPYFAQRLLESREQAEKLMQSSRTLLQSITRDLDKLKARQTLLRYYRELRTEDTRRREITAVFLKQHWLETVEKRRGSMSLLRLSSQFPQRQLLAQFMNDAAADSVQQAELDWLDHTLTLRREEFLQWVKTSEAELEKQLQLQQTQLKQDLNRLKLDARWLKPLLEQANPPKFGRNSTPSRVSAFNTMTLHLVLLAQGPCSVEELVQRGELPKVLLSPKVRRYRPLLILEMEFRATRTRSPGIRGRVEMRLTSYGLREDEISILQREMVRQELGESILAIDASAQDMVVRLMEVTDDVTNRREPATSTPSADNLNPFTALFSLVTRLWHWMLGKSGFQMFADTHLEKVARCVAINHARDACQSVFHSLKAQHSQGAVQP